MEFRLIFESASGARTKIELAERVCPDGHKVLSGEGAGLNWHVLDRGNGEYGFSVILRGDEPVTGRALAVFDWHGPQKGYTLIPGSYYNGNDWPRVKRATCLRMPDRPRFRISLAAPATPCVVDWDGGKTARHIAFSPDSYAGWSGVELDGEENTITYSLPAGTDDCNGDRELRRYPFTWHRGDVVRGRFKISPFDCEKPADLFRYLFEEGREVYKHPAHNEMRGAAEETAAMVRDFLMKRHYYETADGTPVLKNATCDFDGPVKPESIQEWNTMLGWCSGTMTALPLLAADGEIREKALKYMDFVTADGFSPSGIKLPIFDGGTWIDPRPEYCPAENNRYDHVRFFCDYLYYLGRAIRYEHSRGVSHPVWEKEFAKEIRLVSDLWMREKDFGLYWEIMEPTLSLRERGTGAGAYALLALIEGYRNGVEPERTRAILDEAAEVYYRRSVVTGRCAAGPNDICEADDSESIAALTDALVQLYELFGGEQRLQRAVEAGRIFASWCVSYCPSFPTGSALEGINVCGGVIANTQNRHIGPGICTNSGSFLKRLGAHTGDARWTALYAQVRAAAYNCVCREDGEFISENYTDFFRKGMVTEQINVYDVYSKPGFAWCVSASWPATNVLLSEFDERFPEQYA